MSDGKSILIVDDEAGMRDLVSRMFAEAGYATTTAPDGAAGAIAARDGDFDLVVMDMSLPKMNGLEALNRIKAVKPSLPVIMITAFGSVKTAVEALRLGAYDYITKPFDLDELQALAQRALAHKRVIDENRFLRGELKQQYGFDNIIGTSPEMQKAYVIAAQVAQTDATVLILGETGTGKEYLARTIHYQSRRADGPFVKVNTSALTESLLESELFGHEKGAFTHAVARRIGRFEAAHKGTIFLDEIGDIALTVQTKLLRVLQEKQFERVGGSETLTTDTRVVAATNCNLEKAIADKEFREDLYYRLNVINIKLLPLRERKNDIEVFGIHFLRLCAEANAKSVKHLSPEALSLLKSHDWPGNIRELQNTIERAVILCNSDTVRPEHLMMDQVSVPINQNSPIGQALKSCPDEETLQPDTLAGIPITAPLREVEKAHIERVLQHMQWNQSTAAQVLGIDRKTLRNKIKEFKLEKK